MKIPSTLLFANHQDATAAAVGIADNIPNSWLNAIMSTGKELLSTMDKKYRNRQLTAFGLDAWRYMQHLAKISPDAHTYTVNVLAPLFMLPDGSPTDTVRRTMSQGIIRFSGLDFSFEA